MMHEANLQLSMDVEKKYKFAALCPPNEEQWRKIYEYVYAQNSFHWKHYLLMSKLPYAHAVVCSTNESDEYIGLIIFIKLETLNISYLGNYFVTEQYRGNGIGSRIWSLMMEHTESSRVVVVASYEEAMVAKYRARVTPVPGRTFIQIQGATTSLRNALKKWMSGRTEIESSYSVKDIDTNETIAAAICFDKKVANFDRSVLLEAYFPLADIKKAILDSDGKVAAISATFPVFHEKDYKIGPVYAENFNLALMSLHALIQDATASNFLITIPNETESGQKMIEFLVQDANCTIEKKPQRSYSREFNCPIEWSKVYAILAHIASSTY